MARLFMYAVGVATPLLLRVILPRVVAAVLEAERLLWRQSVAVVRLPFVDVTEELQMTQGQEEPAAVEFVFLAICAMERLLWASNPG